MTVFAPQSRPSVRRLTEEEIELEIADIESRRGTIQMLQDKARREILTADERAEMRRLDALIFLKNRK